MKIYSLHPPSSSFIYGLVDPRTGEVRYIGKTVNGERRLRSHRSQMKGDRSHKGAWLRQLRKLGLTFEMNVLEVASPDLLLERESVWIAFGREQGWPLTNLTNGGEGLHGHKFSQEHREKISIANRGRKLTEDQRSRFLEAIRSRDPSSRTAPPRREGPLSTETRRRIGEAHRGMKKIWSDEGRTRFVASHGKPVIHVQTGMTFSSVKAAATSLGLEYSGVLKAASGKYRQINGHSFRYAS